MPLWSPTEAIVTYYTTELNALGNGSFSTAGAAVTNSTARYPYIQLELVLASLSPTTGAAVNIWIDYAVDGSNYSDPAKPLQVTSLLVSLQLDTTAATAQRISLSTPATLLPYDFKMQIQNLSGVAFGATGNTFKYSRFYM